MQGHMYSRNTSFLNFHSRTRTMTTTVEYILAEEVVLAENSEAELTNHRDDNYNDYDNGCCSTCAESSSIIWCHTHLITHPTITTLTHCTGSVHGSWSERYYIIYTCGLAHKRQSTIFTEIVLYLPAIFCEFNTVKIVVVLLPKVH